MTPERAAEVLRGIGGGGDLPLARGMGADALEFCEWLFSHVGLGDEICVTSLYQRWHGEDSFIDYCKADWEKERNG